MERWREAWRGITGFIPTKGLLALREAIACDDPGLVQNKTTIPAARSFTTDDDCHGACAIAYCFWHGFGIKGVGELRFLFEAVSTDADEHFTDLNPRRRRRFSYHFVRWFDRSPRERVRAELLVEVERELAERSRTTEQRGPASSAALKVVPDVADWFEATLSVHRGEVAAERKRRRRRAAGKPAKRNRALVGA